MPEKVERCVEDLMKNPNFKPRKGKTKKESAWAICQAAQNKAKAHEMILPFIPVVEGADGKAPKRIQVLPIGLWDAPFLPDYVKNEQGKLEITADDIDQIIENFNNDVRVGVPIDLEHDGGEAAGWMTALERVGNFLEATVEWTKLGLEKIKAKQFRFFSPEFSPDYMDPETGEKKGWVLLGGGLVNRPLFKELAPITAKENLTGDMGAMVLLVKTQSDSHMTKKLTAILAKDVAKLNDEEKAYLQAHESELNDDQKAAYKDIFAKEGDECTMGGKTGKMTMMNGKMKCVVKGQETTEEETETEEKDVDNSGEEETETDETSETTETEEEETVTGKEKTVAIKASELRELKANAKQGVEALNKLHMIEAQEKAQKYIVGSENGRVLPAGKDDLTTLILSFSEKQAKLFQAVMKNVPDAQMFREIGQDESNVGNFTQQFENLIQKIMADEKVAYKVAMNKAKLQNSTLYKSYIKEIK